MLELINIALPYINGIIHIGHVYEMLHGIYYLNILKNYKKIEISSGLDCHGLIKKYNIKKVNYLNIKKLNYLNIKININKTNTFINKRICNWVYIILCDKNYIIGKIEKKFFNNKKNFYIPDKYLSIVCYYCKNILISNYCNFCNSNKFKILTNINKNNIVLKSSKNILFKNYLFNEWDISRIINYNGFYIISKKITFFYVWFDAIISYISNNIKKKFFYKKNALQIFGKDIIFFHKVYNIILKILKYNSFKTNIHGFIIFKNEKISKSKKKKKIKINDFCKFFLLLNLKNNKKDIKIIKKVKKFYKIFYLNKFINSFFRIRKILEKFDNKIYYIKKKKKQHNLVFCLFKLNNVLLYIKKIFFNCNKINKNINKNKFWKKTNFFLIHYFYTININKIINFIKIFFQILKKKKMKSIFNNLIFNIKKYDN